MPAIRQQHKQHKPSNKNKHFKHKHSNNNNVSQHQHNYVKQPIPVVDTTITNNQYIQFEGSKNFRDRIVCATLSGRRIRIDNIRNTPDDHAVHIGLYDYEINFLRLIEKLTDQCKIQINHNGTAIKYTPGVVQGGYDITHICSNKRGVGYYIEPLTKLCLFAKQPTEITLNNCVTNNNTDITVDILRTVTSQIVNKFGLTDDKIDIKCSIRGCEPDGGGQVIIKIPTIKQLQPIQLIDEGLIKRVRGLSFTSKCTPQYSNRIIDSARAVLNKLLPDVYIYSEHCTGKNAGHSSGYGISLVAESTTGVLYSAEQCHTISDDNTNNNDPESIGNICAKLLLNEINNGGCVDTIHQSIILLYMCLTSEDVNKIRIGKLTQYTIECLRLYKQFFNIQFKLTTEPKTNTIIASCVGSGYKNTARKAA